MKSFQLKSFLFTMLMFYTHVALTAANPTIPQNNTSANTQSPAEGSFIDKGNVKLPVAPELAHKPDAPLSLPEVQQQPVSVPMHEPPHEPSPVQDVSSKPQAQPQVPPNVPAQNIPPVKSVPLASPPVPASTVPDLPAFPETKEQTATKSHETKSQYSISFPIPQILKTFLPKPTTKEPVESDHKPHEMKPISAPSIVAPPAQQTLPMPKAVAVPANPVAPAIQVVPTIVPTIVPIKPAETASTITKPSAVEPIKQVAPTATIPVKSTSAPPPTPAQAPHQVPQAAISAPVKPVSAPPIVAPTAQQTPPVPQGATAPAKPVVQAIRIVPTIEPTKPSPIAPAKQIATPHMVIVQAKPIVVKPIAPHAMPQTKPVLSKAQEQQKLTDQDLQRFIQDEVQMLSVQDDDVILGVLTIDARFAQIGYSQYLSIYTKYRDYVKRLSQVEDVKKFVEYSDKIDGNDIPILSDKYLFNGSVMAIEGGKIDTLRTLADNYGIMDLVDKDGNNLLHIAALRDDAVVTKWLIMRGANVNSINYDSISPKDIAEYEQYWDVFNLLKAANAQ